MAIEQSAIEQVLHHVVPLIEAFLAKQQDNTQHRPFKLSLSGLQGSGKSTWAAALARALQQSNGYKVVIVSLDDFYHNHDNLVRIRDDNPDNKMLRTRGQPGTHDERLAQEFFASLTSGNDIKVPFFDKSQFNGEGDRAPVDDWTVIKKQDLPLDVLIFEGWCLGFQSLPEVELRTKWEASSSASHQAPKNELSSRCSTQVLQDHRLEHVTAINDSLSRYNESFMSNFDYLVHLDTDDLANVYRWRLGQEHALKAAKGRGMSDEAVIEFVRGYMPAYELYLERLKAEAFIPHSKGTSTQLKVMLDVNRKVVGVREL